MAQTGKTPKKKPSAAQAEFKTAYRFKRQLDPIEPVGTLQQLRQLRRMDQQYGRMKFERKGASIDGRKPPVFDLSEVDLRGTPEDNKRFRKFQRIANYHVIKQHMGTRNPAVPSPNDVGTFPRLRMPTGSTTPRQAASITERPGRMVKRPRGGAVYSIGAPLLGALGDYIGRNTSVGQQLRSQMMKEQPSKKR